MYIFITECQKSLEPFVGTSTCTRGKTHILLDLFAKDTAVELMYINMHVRGNSHTFGNDSY